MKNRLNKYISLICVCALFLSLAPCFLKAKAALSGDINGDSKVTLDDVRLALCFSSGAIKPSSAQKKAADLDGDGNVTTIDARKILAAGLQLDPAGSYADELKAKGFPVSYIDGLTALHKKYPAWNFEPFITNLDWSSVISGERTPHKKQMIEKSVSSQYKCDCDSCDGVIQEGPNWVSASKEAVEYYMDPRNWFDEQHIFQFEKISYLSSQSVKGVEAIIKDTWMSNAYITYKDAFGNDVTYLENGNKLTYSQAIINAAKDSNISAYYIASKIVQEVGSTSASVAGGSCGTFSPYKGIYNYYNIGAYTGASDGLKWANGNMKTSSSSSAPLYKTASTSAEKLVTVPASTSLYYAGESGSFYRVNVSVSAKQYSGYIQKSLVSVSDSYGRPWNTPQKSIYYGAQYINSQFASQFTNYLQKFNVNPASHTLYNNEYMANVRAAVFEAESSYKAYAAMGELAAEKTFSIPVFKNMPGQDVDWRESFPSYKPTISCTAKTQTSATLQWSAVYNADGYALYKYDKSAKKYTLLKTTAAQSYTDASLTAGQQALYKVCAYYLNESGSKVYSAYSDEYTVTTYTQPVQQTQTGVVKVDDWLNVRSGAGTSYEKIVQLPSGTKVAVLDRSGDWYKISVTYGGKSYIGYASADYIVLDEVVVEPVDEPDSCPYSEPSATLRKGDTGNGVKWLQWHLYKLGYLASSGDIDGDFGTKTYNGVVQFQTAKKLDVDGIVGSATRTALKNAVK